MKNLILIIAILLTSYTGNTQNTEFGIKAGIQQSNFIIDGAWQAESFKSIINFHASPYIRLFTRNVIGLSIEPGMIIKGAQGLTSTAKITLQYITLPVLANINIERKVYVEGGIAGNYLLGARHKIKGQQGWKSTGMYDKFEVAALIGINYIVNKKIDLGFRYSKGLISAYDYQYSGPNAEKAFTTSISNQYFQLSIRYKN